MTNKEKQSTAIITDEQPSFFLQKANGFKPLFGLSVFLILLGSLHFKLGLTLKRVGLMNNSCEKLFLKLLTPSIIFPKKYIYN